MKRPALTGCGKSPGRRNRLPHQSSQAFASTGGAGGFACLPAFRRGFFRILLALLLAGVSFPQELPPGEQQALSQALSEAGTSPIELVRALENHLAKFPLSPKRAELERLLVKGALETKDERRIILYGERVLARDQDDLQILDRVARALLSSDARDTSERALKYAQRYEHLVAEMRKQPGDSRGGQAQWQEELDRGSARALALEARATGNLGKMDEAVSLAKKSYAAFPTAEAAREIGRWLARSGKEEEAIPYIADAFVLADPKSSDAERAADRKRMGELYRKLKGSEKGLGDLILEAYDRTNAQMADRKSKLGLADPNIQAAKVLDFTLLGVKGDKLQLTSLQGKAIVFDFWATWCGPCRAQHPLYEEVKQKYHSNSNVAFVSVNTDEDRSLVAPFLKDQKWSQAVYFEDGLTRRLEISSIPTTIVINRRGEITSRLNGFVPERFVDMLSDRIEEALK
jgi:thiol-disulfide isomerase/thioredoxin